MLPHDKSEINCESQQDKEIKSSNNVLIDVLIGPFIVLSLGVLIGRILVRSFELEFFKFLVDHSKMS